MKAGQATQLYFQKLKKEIMQSEKIKTQASHGGYDVDGPQEVRDCFF